MFKRGKVAGSPSIPRELRHIIKDRLQVPIAARAASGTGEEWTDVQKTSDTGEEWTDVHKTSDSDFASEDYYLPVEQLRCDEFSSLDCTDRLVIPSSESLLDVDSDDFEYFKNAKPVAASTPLFPDANFLEDETQDYEYLEHAKFVNKSTSVLPEAPVLEDISGIFDCLKLSNPKLASTFIFPEEMAMMNQLKPLTGCRSIDLSSISPASLPFETNFESDIQYTPQNNKSYSKDKEINSSMDATIAQLSNFSISNSTIPEISSESEDDSILNLSVLASSKKCSVCSRNSQNISGSVIKGLQEEIGSRTISFFNTLKRNKRKLNNIQRKGTVANPVLDETKVRRLKDISNNDFIQTRNVSVLTAKKENVLPASRKECKKSEDLEIAKKKTLWTANKNTKKISRVQPENQTFMKDVPICCLSTKQDVRRPLKVMKPFYRSDVPIDVLSFNKEIMQSEV